MLYNLLDGETATIISNIYEYYKTQHQPANQDAPTRAVAQLNFSLIESEAQSSG